MTNYEEYKNRILDIKYIFLNNQIDLIDYQYTLALIYESIYVISEDLKDIVKIVFNNINWPAKSDDVKIEDDIQNELTYLSLFTEIKNDLNSLDTISDNTQIRMINILDKLNMAISNTVELNETKNENNLNCIQDCSHCQTSCNVIEQNNDFSSNIDILKIEDLNINYLREYLLANKILKNECSICGLSEWQNNYLKLELDFIDKNKMNQNVTNIRLLCPNCFSQVGYNE